jgi:flagellar motor switch protein FliN
VSSPVNREANVLDPESEDAQGASAPPIQGQDSDPFAGLPRLGLRQVRLERRLARWTPNGRLPVSLKWLEDATAAPVLLEKAEVICRASGLKRPSLVVQLTAPRLAARLALGIEIPLAHTVVDRLLGFDRPFGESRLQLSPVEWGVWSFLILRALDSLSRSAAPEFQDSARKLGMSGLGNLTLDRVGPDPFDPSGLGSIVTIRWPVRLGSTSGAVRLWLPEPVVEEWLATPSSSTGDQAVEERKSDPSQTEQAPSPDITRGELWSTWRAEAGSVELPQGLKRLRVGAILPVIQPRPLDPPSSPNGGVDLVLDMDDQNVRCRIPARPVADSGGRLLSIEAGLLREPRPRAPIDLARNERNSMSQQQQPVSANPPAAGVAALDVPVTLTVELGRVNLSLTQLADLKPGDVVELLRHSRGPVELTSSGRLVARGELVLIDADLGVRVTNVFL